MTLFSATIIASADDAIQEGGTTVINSSAATINATTDYAGFRFQNVTIPQGATINSATLTFYFTSGSFDDPDVTIYGEDVDNAAEFAAGSNTISGRSLTTANVVWNSTGVGVGTEVTPDISALVQAIVNRGGYASGNAMAFILKGNSTNAGRIRMYDSTDGSYATFDCDYTAAATGQPAMARMRQVPGARRPHGRQGW